MHNPEYNEQINPHSYIENTNSIMNFSPINENPSFIFFYINN